MDQSGLNQKLQEIQMKRTGLHDVSLVESEFFGDQQKLRITSTPGSFARGSLESSIADNSDFVKNGFRQAFKGKKSK
jgi:hypothetical protein